MIPCSKTRGSSWPPRLLIHSLIGRKGKCEMKLKEKYLTNPDAITELLNEQMKHFGINGISMAMIHEGDICYQTVLGVKNPEGEPMTEDTLNESASLTKTLFGTLVMRMVQEGKIDLDRPIMDVYRGKPWSEDPRFLTITPRQCLSHGCGMPNWQEKPIDILFDPGTKYSYSGEGYFLLQHMIEQEEGKDLTALFKEYFLEPLGMYRTTATWTPEVYEQFSCGFGVDGEVVKVRDKRRTEGNAPEPCAAWSLYGNAFEMVKFQQYMIREHGGLNDEVFSEMHKAQNWATDEIPWGLGWGLTKKDPGILWHWGDNSGFESFSILDWKTGDAIIIYTNSDRGSALWNAVVSEMTDAPMEDITEFVKIAE